jgi:hypothetical protein
MIRQLGVVPPATRPAVLPVLEKTTIESPSSVGALYEHPPFLESNERRAVIDRPYSWKFEFAIFAKP